MNSARIVGFCVAVPCFVACIYGIHALAALCGVQNLLWPHVWVGIWGIRLLSVLVAGFVGWAVCHKVFQWRCARLVLAIILPIILIVAGPFVAFLLSLFMPLGSDYQLISPGTVNSRLPELMHLPPSARDVHMWYVGGISPGVVLRFTTHEKEASAYVQGVAEYIAAKPEGRKYTGPGAAEARDRKHMVPQEPPPFTMHGRPWWRPQKDRPWWYFLAPRANEVVFVQLAADGQTVYLYRSVE